MTIMKDRTLKAFRSSGVLSFSTSKAGRDQAGQRFPGVQTLSWPAVLNTGKTDSGHIRMRHSYQILLLIGRALMNPLPDRTTSWKNDSRSGAADGATTHQETTILLVATEHDVCGEQSTDTSSYVFAGFGNATVHTPSQGPADL